MEISPELLCTVESCQLASISFLLFAPFPIRHRTNMQDTAGKCVQLNLANKVESCQMASISRLPAFLLHCLPDAAANINSICFEF